MNEEEVKKKYTHRNPINFQLLRIVYIRVMIFFLFFFLSFLFHNSICVYRIYLYGYSFLYTSTLFWFAWLLLLFRQAQTRAMWKEYIRMTTWNERITSLGMLLTIRVLDECTCMCACDGGARQRCVRARSGDLRLEIHSFFYIWKKWQVANGEPTIRYVYQVRFYSIQLTDGLVLPHSKNMEHHKIGFQTNDKCWFIFDLC